MEALTKMIFPTLDLTIPLAILGFVRDVVLPLVATAYLGLLGAYHHLSGTYLSHVSYSLHDVLWESRDDAKVKVRSSLEASLEDVVPHDIILLWKIRRAARKCVQEDMFVTLKKRDEQRRFLGCVFGTWLSHVSAEGDLWADTGFEDLTTSEEYVCGVTFQRHEMLLTRKLRGIVVKRVYLENPEIFEHAEMLNEVNRGRLQMLRKMAKQWSIDKELPPEERVLMLREARIAADPLDQQLPLIEREAKAEMLRIAA